MYTHLSLVHVLRGFITSRLPVVNCRLCCFSLPVILNLTFKRVVVVIPSTEMGRNNYESLYFIQYFNLQLDVRVRLPTYIYYLWPSTKKLMKPLCTYQKCVYKKLLSYNWVEQFTVIKIICFLILFQTTACPQVQFIISILVLFLNLFTLFMIPFEEVFDQHAYGI